MKPIIKKKVVTSYIYEVTDCYGNTRSYENALDAIGSFECELKDFNVIKQLKKKGVTLLALKKSRWHCGDVPCLVGFNGVPYSEASIFPESGRVGLHMHPLDELDRVDHRYTYTDVQIGGEIKATLNKLYHLLTSVGKVDIRSGACCARWNPSVGEPYCAYTVREGLEEGFWWWNYDGRRFTTNYPTGFSVTNIDAIR